MKNFKTSLDVEPLSLVYSDCCLSYSSRLLLCFKYLGNQVRGANLKLFVSRPHIGIGPFDLPELLSPVRQFPLLHDDLHVGFLLSHLKRRYCLLSILELLGLLLYPLGDNYRLESTLQRNEVS